MYFNKFSLIQEEEEQEENEVKIDKYNIIEKNYSNKLIHNNIISNIINREHPYFKTKNITKTPSIDYLGIELNDEFPETAFIDINSNTIFPKLIDENINASDLIDFSHKIPNHWGQRKLLLSEIYFLTQIYEDKEIIVIYAGAAPGTHLPILVNMFPKITFHLYDPKRFDSCLNLYSNVIVNLYYDNINYKYKESRLSSKEGSKNKKYGLFTSEVAKWYSEEFFDKETNFYFISDIRTVPKNLNYSTLHFTDKFEKEVLKNQMEQMNWISIMKPKLSMLKFKTPYPSVDRDQYYKYLRGQVYLQVWSPTSSSETRLFVSDEDIDHTGWFDTITYERKLAYYNYLRQFCFNDIKISFIEGETLYSWWSKFVDNVDIFTIDFYNELLILKYYYDKFVLNTDISIKDFLSKKIVDITNLLNIIYIEAQPINDKDIKDYNKIFRLRRGVNDIE